MAGSVKKPKCKVKGCGRAALCRGLCRPCYMAARREVLNETTTWEKLEAKGLADTPKMSPFTRAFASQ